MAKNNSLFDKFLYTFLSIFYYLLYGQFAFTYKIVSSLVSGGLWVSWVKEIVSEINGDTVLELGNGPGILQIELQKRNHTVYGLDLSKQMIDLSWKNISSIGYNPNLVQGDGRFLPYETNSISEIVSTFPTAYIFESNTSKELYRVLSDTGRFICMPIAWITGQSIRFRILKWLFSVTGQSPPIEEIDNMNFERYFKDAGFATQVKINTLENSKVLILIATKTTE